MKLNRYLANSVFSIPALISPLKHQGVFGKTDRSLQAHTHTHISGSNNCPCCPSLSYWTTSTHILVSKCCFAAGWSLVQILPSVTRGIVILTVINISINQDWRFGTWIRNGPDCLRVLLLFCFIWTSASHSQKPTLDRVISEPGPQPAAVSSHPTNHCSVFSSDILTSLLPPPLV